MSGVKRPSADEMLPWVFNLMGLQRERQINLTAAAALVHSQINAVTTSFKILLISEVI